MQYVELKIKVKNLADEARDIRKEELRARDQRDNATREKLYLHRIHRVRPAARSTQLAYAYLRGREYLATERPAHNNPPNLAEICRMVRKYGPEQCKETVEAGVKAWLR